MKIQYDISIISPVYNEEGNIKELYGRIKGAVPGQYNWELIFIDDGSEDSSKQIIREICNCDNRVMLISLSRNYGQQVALTAGYDVAYGKVVISLDSDLQHPPELIPQMLDLWKNGNDIIFARRRINKKLGWFNRTSSKLFYSLLKRISNIPIVENSADFRLMDQKVVKYLRRYRESTRFIRGIVSDMGFRRAVIDYEEGIRKAGKAKYSLYDLIDLSIRGVASLSDIPLTISIFVGMFISSLSIIYALWLAYYKIIYGMVSGLASILVGVFFIGGVQLIFIGILGEYIASIFREVKRRPLYCISQIYGREEKE